jgi:SpoVK/Ycf46/Vps4 family AAA+-type ATPase
MLAQDWGAIVLIDEADIYMEQRSLQDIQRNHLVAGFLRSLEYYKGMVFRTTNRVGTFDEAFMSRIHTKIHYPNFEEDDRQKLWDSFFQKLEGDRETTMRITQSAKDYVSSQDLRALKWNGREIRNGELLLSLVLEAV